MAYGSEGVVTTIVGNYLEKLGVGQHGIGRQIDLLVYALGNLP